MIDFLIKVPDDKAEFFSELMQNLDYEFHNLSTEYDSFDGEENDEIYFTDSDD